MIAKVPSQPRTLSILRSPWAGKEREAVGSRQRGVREPLSTPSRVPIPLPTLEARHVPPSSVLGSRNGTRRYLSS